MSYAFELPPPDKRIPVHHIQCPKPPNFTSSEKSSRVVGSLMGLALGDALGASVEFRPRDYLRTNPVSSMQSGGTWGLQAGQWTDDTSMALCLASSLIIHGGFNPYDQLVRYKWWYQRGFLSSTGNCFDIGGTTRTALEEFARRQNNLKRSLRNYTDDQIDRLPYDEVKRIDSSVIDCGLPNKYGNGPLMRLAAIPLFYFRNPQFAVDLAGESARITHAHPIAIDSCRYFAALIVAAIKGATKKDLLDERFYENHQSWFGSRQIHEEVLRIAHGSYKKRGGYDDGIRGHGSIDKTLEAALWAFWSDGDSFKTGACNVVNLGDDTDTTAAVYGQLAGAHYGYEKLPQDWIRILYAGDLIMKFGQWLFFRGEQSGTRASLIAQSTVPPHRPSIEADRIGYSIPSKKQERQRLDPSKLPPAGRPSGAVRH